MKIIFFLLIASFETFASDCYLFQLKGMVEDSNGFRIKIHEGTNSEKYFVFSQAFDLKMAVFHKKFVQGKFILKNKEPVSGSEIAGIETTELAVPDPLYHHEEIRFLKTISCPKTSKNKI